MDLIKLTKQELLVKCEELGITRCKSKTKAQLIELIDANVKDETQGKGSGKTAGLPEGKGSEKTVGLPEGKGQGKTVGFPFIDLFCGIGGFHQALKRLNGTCVFACDIDEKCRETYEKNYGLKPHADITKVNVAEIPDFDVLCAGFPCFVAGTRVLTNNGYKPIETVELTDKLLTHTGNMQKILNLQQKIYTGKLFEFDIKYHPEMIVATEEHPFYVREKHNAWNSTIKKRETTFGEPQWKVASKLTMDDYFGMVINDKSIVPEFTLEKKINQRKTEIINIKMDNPDYWFMMGYWIGDGWIEETKRNDGRTMHKIRFAINNKDETEIFEKINRVLPITDKKCSTGLCKKFGCSNFTWFHILKKFGKYAHGKTIPEWVQDAPKELIQEFINGYMKADGCYTKNETVLQITTVSENLAYGIQRLYLKLGHIFSINKFVRPSTCVIDGRTVNQRDTYCVRGILQKDRNTSSFIEGNYVWYAPFKITSSETTNTPVYNFEVETDNSYIVENVCVHNCQAFSNSGKKKGFDDKRGRLYEYILDIAAAKRPRFLFLENVKHIKTIDDGKVFEEIMRRIGETGYTAHITELSPHQLGVPQQRERVIFTCIRNDIYDPAKSLEFPLPKVPINVDAIFEKDPTKTAKYRISKDDEAILSAWDEMVKQMETGQNMSPTILCNEFGKAYSETEFAGLAAWRREYITKNKPIYNKYKVHWDAWREKHQTLLAKKEIYGKLEWQAGIKKENDSIFNHFIQLRQSGIRVKKTEYFPTLVAIVQTPIYAKEKRYITPRECARLQSFPDDFIMCENDHTAYKQFGNAVNVDVVHFVINNVLQLYQVL